MPEYSFKLYVSGTSHRSERAIRDAQRMCEQRFHGDYELSVIDLAERPELAPNVLATPTLVRSSPGPARLIVGDLSDIQKVETALGLVTRSALPAGGNI